MKIIEGLPILTAAFLAGAILFDAAAGFVLVNALRDYLRSWNA